MAGVGENKSDQSSCDKDENDIIYDKTKVDIITELLNTDLTPVLKSDALHDSVKEFMQKSQNAVSVISKENKVLIQEKDELAAQLKSFLEKQSVYEQQNQTLISNLQSQINDLKQEKTLNSGSSSSSVNKNVSSISKDISSMKNLTKPNVNRKNSGQTKLTQFTSKKDQVATSNPSTSSTQTPTGNKFTPLQDEETMETQNDAADPDSEDASLSEDANSDPEFRSKRLIYRQQRKKRKRGNSPQDPSTANNALNNKDKSIDKNSTNNSNVEIDR